MALTDMDGLLNGMRFVEASLLSGPSCMIRWTIKNRVFSQDEQSCLNSFRIWPVCALSGRDGQLYCCGTEG